MAVLTRVALILTLFGTTMMANAEGIAQLDLLGRFLNAETDQKWQPSSAEIKLARKLIGDKKARPDVQAAANYCLALTEPEPDQYVTRLVANAIKVTNVPDADERSREAMPSALFNLFMRRNSKSAARAIAELDLDGAPGEILYEVGQQALAINPKLLSDAWCKLPHSKRSTFPRAMAEMITDPKEKDEEIRKLISSRWASVRQLGRALRKLSQYKTWLSEILAVNRFES